MSRARGFTISELGLGLYVSVAAPRQAVQAADQDDIEAQRAGVLSPKLGRNILVPWADERERPLTVYTL